MTAREIEKALKMPILQSQNDFLREWLPRRALYLKVILSQEAPRDPLARCSCGHRMANWRCKTCSGGRLLCSRCCRNAHTFLPFHRVELWNGRYFEVGALWQIGLKLHLGHEGMLCPARAPWYRDEGNGMSNGGAFYSLTTCFRCCGRGCPRAGEFQHRGGWIGGRYVG